MSKYRIVTDAAADLPPELVEKYNISVIPMQCHLGGDTFIIEPTYKNLSPVEFYNQMRAGAVSSTSMINEFMYTEFFTPIYESGEDIIFIALSLQLTTSQHLCRLAVEALKEKFPERRTAIFDSMTASMGEGVMAYMAAQKRDEGLDFDELVKWLEEHRQNFCSWFTVEDLAYLKRSGRLSAASAFLGTALRIKPVLRVDEEGRLTPLTKVQGRKNSLKSLVDNMESTFIPGETNIAFIAHADCLEDAEALSNHIKERFGLENFVIYQMSPIIGTHVGPGTLALFHYGKHR